MLKAFKVSRPYRIIGFKQSGNLGLTKFGVLVRVGSNNDPVDKLGMAHFLEHMLFRQKIDGKEVSEILEKYGASFNAYTTKDYTYFFVETLDAFKETVFDLLLKIVFYKLDRIETEESLETERAIVIEEIKSYQDMPFERAIDKSLMHAFPIEFGHPIIGDIANIQRITLKDLQEFSKKYFFPNNMIFSVCTTTSRVPLVKMMRDKIREIGAIHTRRARFKDHFITEVQQDGHIILDDLDSSQNHFIQTCVVSRKRSLPTWRLFTKIMSDYYFKKVRVERGLCYSIEASLIIQTNFMVFQVKSSYNREQQEQHDAIVAEVLNKNNDVYAELVENGAQAKLSMKRNILAACRSGEIIEKLVVGSAREDEQLDIKKYLEEIDEVVPTFILDCYHEVVRAKQLKFTSRGCFQADSRSIDTDTLNSSDAI